MARTSIQLRMFIPLVWLMFVLCNSNATQRISCDHLDPVTCQNSGDDRNCGNVYLQNDDHKTHSCGKTNKDKEKEKHTLHKVPIFRGVYTFPVDPIPRRNCFDEEAMEFIQQGLPVVLENCTFHKPAMKWTIKYLVENLQDKDHTAYFSTNRKFLYYDDDRIKGAYKDFQPPTKKMLLYFKNFSELMAELDRADNGSRAYFQSMLYLQDGVSASMLEDINTFDYSWLLDLVRRVRWGEDVTNLLLVGMSDVVTPAHFDILENLYVQIFGRKRVILFSPDYFRSLYPYPVGHPHDRQTQVDFDNPDFDKFPRFSEIRGMEVALEKDEVLYIPNYWWHYIESESQSKTISMNFWFEPKNETKTSGDKKPQKSDATNVETDKKAEVEEQENMLTEGKDVVHSKELLELINEDSKQNVEENDEEKGDQKKDDDEQEQMAAEGVVKNDEDDEKEIILYAAKYLALLRETETSLFRATFSHKKVKQILEELLSGRFDYLEKH